MLGKSVADGYNVALDDAKIEGRSGLLENVNPRK